MNIIKTGLLLAALTALFGWIGLMLGGQQGMLIALGVAVAMNIGSYWFSDSIVLRMYNAQPIDHGDVYDLTRDLAQRAGLPMPKVYIIDSPQPNAFATGRNPQNAAVAVNTGLIDILTRNELTGVIAHELAHIKNRDTLIMTITATIAGAISMLANFAMFFGGTTSQNGERQGPNPLIGILIMFLAPIAAMLVQMAISRTREYSADKTGAEISGDPMALASALRKLERSAHIVPNETAEANPATAHMFIINPLHGGRIDNLFSTHPSTQNRVDALQQLVPEKPKDSFSSNPWEATDTKDQIWK